MSPGKRCLRTTAVGAIWRPRVVRARWRVRRVSGLSARHQHWCRASGGCFSHCAAVLLAPAALTGEGHFDDVAAQVSCVDPPPAKAIRNRRCSASRDPCRSSGGAGRGRSIRAERHLSAVDRGLDVVIGLEGPAVREVGGDLSMLIGGRSRRPVTGAERASIHASAGRTRTR
jgi:hypothetical protein